MGFRLKKNSHTLKQRAGYCGVVVSRLTAEETKDRFDTGSLWLCGGEGRLAAWFTGWEDPEAAVGDIGLAWCRFPRSDPRPLGSEL